MSKRLIVLDINGTLCYRFYIGSLESYEVDKLKISFDMILIPKFIVFLRPHVYDFLSMCFDKFDVGFFSSMTERHGSQILDILLTKEQKEQVKFIWYRDKTRPDPDFGIKPEITNYDTIKMAQDIVDSFDRYKLEDILICDDSETKLRFNKSENTCVIRSFNLAKYILNEVNLEDNELLRLMNSL